jgi:hypothetical protein
MYAIRRTLLSDFSESLPPTTDCPCCLVPGSAHPMHHLTCKSQSSSFTLRHTCAVNLPVDKLKEVRRETQGVGVFSVTASHTLGGHLSRANNAMKPDFEVVTDAGTTKRTYDVGITAASTIPRQWPTDTEVEEAIQKDATVRRDNRRKPLFFWEDHSDEHTHPIAVRSRKFRSLALDRSIRKDIMEYHKRKIDHYNGAAVKPLIMSAGGVPSEDTRQFLSDLTTARDSDIAVRAHFNQDLVGSLSIILVNFAHWLNYYLARKLSTWP